MKSTSKTPYEIRLELLQLAQCILREQHYAKGHANALSKNSAEITENVFVTTSPTTEDIIAEAEKMNAFISKANQSH